MTEYRRETDTALGIVRGRGLEVPDRAVFNARVVRIALRAVREVLQPRVAETELAGPLISVAFVRRHFEGLVARELIDVHDDLARGRNSGVRDAAERQGAIVGGAGA